MNDDADEQPRASLTMIGLVALIVAVVILVFFGIGYLFGRAVPVSGHWTPPPDRDVPTPPTTTLASLMLALAVFGIKNSTINLAVELVILFLVVIWLALVYWTYADARRRIADPLLIGCATAASLFPFVGTIVYMIVRPPEYLDDVRERELEMQAAEARLAELGYHLCPHCDYEVEKDFLRCPNCMRKLKDPCTACGKPLDPMWKICPFCEAEIGRAPPQPRRARRRRERLRAAGRRRHRARRATAAPAPERRPPSAASPRRHRDAVSRSRHADPDRRPHAHRRRPDGANADPGQARRLRPQPDRRDHRPVRAQGPAAGRAEPDDDDPRAGRAATTPSTRASRSTRSL